MFTSRAERRLLLRQDNAFLRLTDRAYNLGLIEGNLYNDFKKEKEIVQQTIADLRAGNSHAQLLRLFGDIECNEQALRSHINHDVSDRAVQTIHAEIRYEPYIKRELHEAEKTEQYRNLVIPDNFNYRAMPGLSRELQEKLIRHKPGTIAQAALIQGMTPAALSLLIFKVREQTNQLRTKNINKKGVKNEEEE
ncbi:MAG TPA: hypothetical protein VFF04_01005 [Candidatus Babeliales bacterium]|nr:hypothetical protein [Candidatus Babeliales bacterium]